MRIAISAMNASPDAPLDLHFGRCSALAIYDSLTQAYTMLDNTGNAQSAQGAGIQAAQAVIQAGAEVVVTGQCGPKAFTTLQAAHIRVLIQDGGTVRQAVAACLAGTLSEQTSVAGRGRHP